ncbi:hypothetical protein BOSE46_100031 [Bosea sp. 46]|nr:hypothetical protein BOSE46_100031 [Bosea sp. 46]CAD5257029.1 hypothetical protein BOSE21B_110034 [Bosea sp. 21B]CAD5284036.1 hypothetical protein BOSE7B_41183 [Bosea sp. 7B]VXB77826.1 hypothetical protein BOSE125_150145 [Bosea sp. 125]VXC90711.1 hypothetical protein BOSE127_70227 [Bosea sp. 127]
MGSGHRTIELQRRLHRSWFLLESRVKRSFQPLRSLNCHDTLEFPKF